MGGHEGESEASEKDVWGQDRHSSRGAGLRTRIRWAGLVYEYLRPWDRSGMGKGGGKRQKKPDPTLTVDNGGRRVMCAGGNMSGPTQMDPHFLCSPAHGFCFPRRGASVAARNLQEPCGIALHIAHHLRILHHPDYVSQPP